MTNDVSERHIMTRFRKAEELMTNEGVNMFGNLFKSLKLLLNPPEFVIKIKGGKAEMITGKLPKPFIDELLELCYRH